MLFRVLLVAAALVVAYLVLRWFLRQPRRTQLQAAALGAGAALILMAATGRMHWIFAAFGALLPLLRRLVSLVGYAPAAHRVYQQFKGAEAGQGPAPGQQSAVQTRFLRMTLEHDSGVMSGSVREGRFAGRELGSMSLDELRALLVECEREDEESAALLRAYLERVHGGEWQAQDGPGPEAGGAFSPEMSRREACDILGLEEGATEQQIRDAHRRLMQKLHPDRGGSTFLAAKINQAKAVLLGEG